jgi:hypothetical protein
LRFWPVFVDSVSGTIGYVLKNNFQCGDIQHSLAFLPRIHFVDRIGIVLSQGLLNSSESPTHASLAWMFLPSAAD